MHTNTHTYAGHAGVAGFKLRSRWLLELQRSSKHQHFSADRRGPRVETATAEKFSFGEAEAGTVSTVQRPHVTSLEGQRVAQFDRMGRFKRVRCDIQN